MTRWRDLTRGDWLLLGVAVGALLLWLAIYGAAAYIVWHFLRKVW